MYAGVVKLYDVTTGQVLNTFIATRRTKLREPRERVTSIAFSPDSTKIASGAGHDVKLWEVSTGENIATFQGQKGAVESIAFSPDGTKLAVGAAEGVKLLNILNGEHIDLLGAIWNLSVAFSPDGKDTCFSVRDWCQTLGGFDREKSHRTTKASAGGQCCGILP